MAILDCPKFTQCVEDGFSSFSSKAKSYFFTSRYRFIYEPHIFGRRKFWCRCCHNGSIFLNFVKILRIRFKIPDIIKGGYRNLFSPPVGGYFGSSSAPKTNDQLTFPSYIEVL